MNNPNSTNQFLGITPYLLYDDASSSADWLVTHFGFEEASRYHDKSGAVTNIELRVGENEIWLDNYPGYWAKTGKEPDQWIGIWIADVIGFREYLSKAGVEPEAIRERAHGVRECSIKDPQGYVWGFLQRI